jgi:hypothetical protein
VRSEGRWQLRHRARYIRSGERFLRELAVCEAATGLTFDVESTIASLQLAPQLAEALLRRVTRRIARRAVTPVLRHDKNVSQRAV